MKLPLEVIAVRKSETEDLSDVVLLNSKSNTVICVSIGTYEAELIAIAKDKKEIDFPLSYDLTLNITRAFDIKLEYVLIDSFRDGVYGAKAYLISGERRSVLEIRISDGINLALRADCPIYVTEELLEEVGFDASALSLDAYVESDTEEEECAFVTWDLELLETMLNDAVEAEDYDLAALIRDQIKDMKSEL
ncbi:MAG: bifunctional nuclease family protein [Bacteroidales bacterium]|nr:bifunctional nuclease family protein [Bacteroidales bacterium]